MNIFERLYMKYCVSSGFSFARYLKQRNFLQFQGNGCFVSKSATITDPYLVKIGSNVWITDGCKLLCHDASVIMINMIQGGHRDSVGPIRIGDNSFLGNNTIILPNVDIGSNTIIGAGSVVTRDIPDNTVWAGNPARFITTMKSYSKRVESKTREYPWSELLQKNSTYVYDFELESKLREMRVNHFFQSKCIKSHAQ